MSVKIRNTAVAQEVIMIIQGHRHLFSKAFRGCREKNRVFVYGQKSGDKIGANFQIQIIVVHTDDKDGEFACLNNRNLQDVP